jgi:hypothetical protein
MAKKGQKDNNFTEANEKPGQERTTHLGLKILFLVAIILMIFSVIPGNKLQNLNKMITLSPPSINQGETTSSKAASNIISKFIIPESKNNKAHPEAFSEEKYLNKKIPAETNPAENSTTEEDLKQIYNHIKYLEQKVQKLEEQASSNRIVIEKKYRTILSLALGLDKKILTGESYNREIILLQLETDDIFINGKIADISDYAVSGTYTTVEINLEFTKIREFIIAELQEEISSSSPFAEAFNGFVSIKRKFKIPASIESQLNLVQESLAKGDLVTAEQQFIELPEKYQNMANNFAQILNETIFVRMSVNDILKYLDV